MFTLRLYTAGAVNSPPPPQLVLEAQVLSSVSCLNAGGLTLLYLLFMTFLVACWWAKLCEVEVLFFSVLQFTEQGLLSAFFFFLRTKLLMEKIGPCEGSNAD